MIWPMGGLVVAGLVSAAITQVAVGEDKPVQEFRATVEKVVDGDTVHLQRDGQRVTVRLLGIDTPETVHPSIPDECGGEEASDAAKDMLPDGLRVRVRTDELADQRDRYGRTLAYVYGKRGRNTAARLLRLGWAEENGYGKPYTRERYFERLERRARAENVGIWGMC